MTVGVATARVLRRCVMSFRTALSLSLSQHPTGGTTRGPIETASCSTLLLTLLSISACSGSLVSLYNACYLCCTHNNYSSFKIYCYLVFCCVWVFALYLTYLTLPVITLQLLSFGNIIAISLVKVFFIP